MDVVGRASATTKPGCTKAKSEFSGQPSYHHALLVSSKRKNEEFEIIKITITES